MDDSLLKVDRPRHPNTWFVYFWFYKREERNANQTDQLPEMVREAKTQWLSMPEHFMTDYRSIASYIRSDIYLELCKCRDFLQSRYVVQSNTNPLVTDHETVCPTSSAGTLCIDSPRRLARDVIAQALGISKCTSTATCLCC